MRVTNKIFNDRFIKNLNTTLQKIDKNLFQLSSGKKNRFPSDSPADIPNIINSRVSIKKADLFLGNISSARPKLNAAENNLTDLFEMLNQAKDLAIKASSSIESKESLEIMANEVSNILDRVFAISNAPSNGAFLFGGHETTSPPFVNNNGQYEYLGSGGEVRQIFSDRVSVATNLTGNSVFQGNVMVSSVKITTSSTFMVPASNGDITFTLGDGINTSSPITFAAGASFTQSQVLSTVNAAISGVSISASFNSTGYLTLTSNVSDNLSELSFTDLSTSTNNASLLGFSTTTSRGIDILKLLGNLENSIRSGDTLNVADMLQSIDVAIEQVIRNTAELGSRGVQLNFLEVRAEVIQQDSTELLSSLEDADFADSVRKMNELENVYKASLSSASRFMNLSLLDFLR